MVWPTAEQVRKAAQDWARRAADHEPAILAIGYFGSYARGDWGVGSDLDLVIVVRDSMSPPDAVVPEPDPASLPVPAELRIYGSTNGEPCCGPTGAWDMCSERTRSGWSERLP